MITNKWKKLINSLHSKKHRKNSSLFLVEGEKVFLELLHSSYLVHYAVVTQEIYHKITTKIDFELIIAAENEIKILSTLQNNFSAIAVVEMKDTTKVDFFKPNQPLSLLLDNIQDPGNLGTIIRTADWYGIQNVLCSETCVDFYNPKVISATKGSFCRIQPIYTDLKSFIQEHHTYKVFGAFMEGTSVYELATKQESFLIMGNESNGIGEELLPFIGEKLTIPRRGEAESLNVAIATSILCDNFARLQ